MFCEPSTQSFPRLVKLVKTGVKSSVKTLGKSMAGQEASRVRYFVETAKCGVGRETT